MRRRVRAEERSEAGETLIEVLMSSALMAIVVVAVIGGLATVLLSSITHRAQADTNTALVSAVEAIKSPSVARVTCAAATEASYLAPAQAAAVAAGYPASALSITNISYQYTLPGDPTVRWDSACHEVAGTPTLTLQLVTVKLTDPDGKSDPEMTFVKGDQ